MLTASHVAHGEVALRPAWVEGRSATYELWSETRQTMRTAFQGDEQAVRFSYTAESRVRWTVLDVARDGSATCEMVTESLRVERTLPDGSRQTIDSGRAASDPALRPVQSMFAAVTSTPITVVVRPDATVASLDGYDDLQRKVDDADLLPDVERFELLALSLAGLPGAPVAAEAGDGWTFSYDAPGEQVAPRLWTRHEVDARYTLTDIGELAGVPVATLAIDRTFDAELDRSELPDNAPPLSLKVTGAADAGRAYFDLDRRELAAWDGRESGTYAVTIRLPNGQSLGQTLETATRSQALRIEETDG